MPEDKTFKRRKRRSVVYTPIATLLIILLVIFGVSIFFRVSEIRVNGERKYTEQAIILASGIKIGDNLVFIDPGAIALKITTTLPYLDEVQIDKLIPSVVEIRVTESQPMAVVSCNGSWWLVDQKARVLEPTNADTASKKIQVRGINPTGAPVGRKITVADGELTKLQCLSDTLAAIWNAGIAGDVKTLDVNNISGISFTYLNRFTVNLGNGANLDYKLTKLLSGLQQLKKDDKGKIDLSKENEFRFIPT